MLNFQVLLKKKKKKGSTCQGHGSVVAASNWTWLFSSSWKIVLSTLYFTILITHINLTWQIFYIWMLYTYVPRLGDTSRGWWCLQRGWCQNIARDTMSVLESRSWQSLSCVLNEDIQSTAGFIRGFRLSEKLTWKKTEDQENALE